MPRVGLQIPAAILTPAKFLDRISITGSLHIVTVWIIGDSYMWYPVSCRDFGKTFVSGLSVECDGKAFSPLFLTPCEDKKHWMSSSTLAVTTWQATTAEHKHGETPCNSEIVCRVRGKHSGALVCLRHERRRLRESFTGEREQGSRDESCLPKSSCDARNPKSLQLFSGLTDFTTGMQSKTVHSSTVILRIPGSNAHMKR
ncbi:Hypothetical predicted protein [Scomber scombrus]|uniref:Uncharacterized protein n=1 Tax=Scomber scombrus TaxID=13677 RepID=A0AAV1PJF2_SCOSC